MVVKNAIPHLNVDSLCLLHLSGVPEHLHWRDVKEAIRSEIGSEVQFVETFEAWFGKKVGHVVLEFRYLKGLNFFAGELEPDWFKRNFKAVPKIEGLLTRQSDRDEFFARIKRKTGVDLLKTGGEPPKRWLIEKEERIHRRHFRDHSTSTMACRGGITRRPRRTGLLSVTPINLRGMLDDEGNDERYIVVENLPPGCSREELEALFDVPPPLSVEVRTDARSGAAIGLVQYADESKALMAELMARDAQLRGRILKTHISRDVELSRMSVDREEVPSLDEGMAAQREKSEERMEQGVDTDVTAKSAHPPVRPPLDEEEKEGGDGDHPMDEFISLLS